MSTSSALILVVEDIPNVREFMEVTLKFRGYQVFTAVNGEDALLKIAEQKPSLVIADVLMPKMDGFSLAQRLRTDEKTSDIPIILVSATYINPDDEKFAFSLGVSRFIEKPFDTEDFLLNVAEVLTSDASTMPSPLESEDFWQGYRERLESKLHYKNTQIARAERLLDTLPPGQKSAFQTMLEQSTQDRNQIRKDLDEVYQSLRRLRNKKKADLQEEPVE